MFYSFVMGEWHILSTSVLQAVDKTMKLYIKNKTMILRRPGVGTEKVMQLIDGM